MLRLPSPLFPYTVTVQTNTLAILCRWLPVIGWSGLIFLGSSDRQSWHHSSRLIEPFVRWLWPDAPDETVRAIVFAARKCAHVTEFAVLALLAWWALRPSPVPPSLRLTDPQRRLLVIGFVALSATLDELHQSLVPNRQGSPIDVLIDTAGAILALLFLSALSRFRQRRRANPRAVVATQATAD